ncbi:hypothetical protein [Frankia sp. CiP3]|uniref:hypothetical protein n=1 Tax=Frankia sp. CiP3 TaxID=2880971 RepID=UPI001EF453CF|nr:hypothetical protein [Frankia sp. CiP3]
MKDRENSGKPDEISRSAILDSRNTDALLFVAQLLGMAAGVTIARLLGPSGRGTVAAFAAWGQFLGWIGVLSVDKAIVVIGKDIQADHDPARLRQLAVLAASTMRPATAAALIAASILGIVLFPILVPLFLILVMVTTLQEFQYGLLIVARNHRRYLGVRLVQPLLYLMLVALLATIPKALNHDGEIMVVGCLVCSSFISLFFGPTLPRPWTRARRATISQRLSRVAREIQLCTALQYLNSRLDLLLAPLLLTQNEVGWYAVGVSVGQVLGFLGTANALRGLAGRSPGIDIHGALAVAAAALVGCALAPTVLPLVFGTVYVQAVPVAQVLLLGGVAVFCLQGCTWRLIGVMGQRAATVSQGVGAVSFAVGVVFEPTMIGLAWMNVLSTMAALIVGEALWYHRRRAVSVPSQELGSEIVT